MPRFLHIPAVLPYLHQTVVNFDQIQAGYQADQELGNPKENGFLSVQPVYSQE
jgi:hypothetical protein